MPKHIQNNDVVRVAGNSPINDPTITPVSGQFFFTNKNLEANESIRATVEMDGESKEWIPHDIYIGMSYSIQSDKSGRMQLEYSQDGVTPDFTPNPAIYDTNPTLFKSGLQPLGKFVRMTYTNGDEATTNFAMEGRLATTIQQPTLRSINSKLAPSVVGQVSASILFSKGHDGNFTPMSLEDAFSNLATSEDIQELKGAVESQPTPSLTVDTASLAKDATLKDGSTKVQVTNLPTTQQVSGSVTIANPTANPETGLAKDTTLSNGSQKTQLVNGTGSAYGTASQPLASRLSDGSSFIDPRQTRALTASDVVTVANPQTSVTVSNLPTTQQVSGTVTVSNPTANPETGLAKDASLKDGSAKVQVTNFPATQAITGALTDIQLRASPIPVSGSLTATSPANTNIYKAISVFNATAIPNTANKVISGYEIFSPNASVVVALYNSNTAKTDNSYIDFIYVPQATAIMGDSLDLGGFTNGIAFNVFAQSGLTLTQATSSQAIRISLRGRNA